MFMRIFQFVSMRTYIFFVVYVYIYLYFSVSGRFWNPYLFSMGLEVQMSTFTWNKEVHALHGSNKHGGFRYPHCAQLCGVETQSNADECVGGI